MKAEMDEVAFSSVMSAPVRNGVYKPKSFIGRGTKLVRMGELFSNSFIDARRDSFQLVELSEKEKEKVLLQDKDLLFSRTSVVADGVGKCSIIRNPSGEEIVPDSNMIRVRIDSKRAIPSYIHALMESSVGRERILSLSGGSAVTTITGSGLSSVKIPLPHIEFQYKVVSILSTYENLIENNTRRIEILEEMTRRLYEEWFVHFRFPGHEEVNSSFEEANIFDVFSVKYGKGLPKKHLVEDGEYPVYGAAKVIGRYTSFNYESRQIIAGCRGSVGEFRITEPKSFVTNNSFIFSPVVSDDFFWGYQALKHRGLKDVVGGAAQPQITLDGLRSVNIAYPEHDVRKAYSDLVSPMFSMMWSLERKNANLRAQRDLLLPKLVSGEIDVSDISVPDDKEVEAA